jgi:hypothetical protein
MIRLLSTLRRRAALGVMLAACCLLPQALSQPPTARAVPQLIEARYFRAELVGDALVGKGEWKVVHPGSGPVVLPLSSLGLAVRQPRFATHDALLADFGRLGTGLLVEEPGEQTVAFDWSARQNPTAEGVQFQLDLPACPISSLELDLPPVWVVTAGGLPVMGPLAAEKPDLKRWRVTCSRPAPLSLALRRRPEAGGPRMVMAGPLLTRQNLTPGAVETEFAFDHLRVVSGEVRELACALDASLRPYEVMAPEIESWSVREPAAVGAPATLLVRLREPLLTGALLVRCLAPLGGKAVSDGAEPWSAPGLRLLDAVPGSETLVLQVHPEVSLEAWEPGGFRLADAKTDAEGQTIRLLGGLIASDGKAGARPSARVRARGADFRVRQLALWRTGPERLSLTAQVSYEVLRGRLFRLSLEVPPGYGDVERLVTDPPRAIRVWDMKAEHGKTTLLVDLIQPLLPESKLALTVVLRPSTAPTGALAWAIPDLVPVGARAREGGLAIDFDERRFDGRLTGAVVTASPPKDGPWGSAVPDYYLPYRDGSVRGRLELRPLPPRLRTHATTSIVLAPGRAVAETTLQLEADAGTAEALDLFVSAPVAGLGDWKARPASNGVASFQRLPGPEVSARLHILAAGNGLSAAALLAAAPRGEWRRLALRRPLNPRDTLALQATANLVRGTDGSWNVPLLAVPGADAGDGVISLYLGGGDPVRVEGLGLREAEPAANQSGPSLPWRTLRYGAGPVTLTLRAAEVVLARAPGASVDRAALTSAAEPDGRLLHTFRFQARGWHEPLLPLRLPAGARLLSVRVNGLWLDRIVPAEEVAGGVLVNLPVLERGGADDPTPSRYEVVYATYGPGDWLWRRLEAPAPWLPLSAHTFLRRWRLPPGVVPLLDGRVRVLPSAAAEPDGRRHELHALDSLSSLVLRPLALDDWDERQRQEVGAAARAARAPAGRVLTLAESLERMACDAAAEREPLVIDMFALEDAGLTPATPVPGDAGREASPFWEAVGLVYVPCRPAPLLTTRARLDDWQAAGGDTTTVPPSVEAAVAEAAKEGHDTSGRFLWALDWVRRGAATAGPPTGSSPLTAVGPGWTEWEPVSGSEDDGVLLAVCRRPVSACGLALMVAVLAAAWAIRREAARLRLALLLICVAVTGAGVVWLPPSLVGMAEAPLLAAASVGLVWYLATIARPPAPSSASSGRPLGRAAVAAGLLALLACSAALVAADEPDRPVPAAPQGAVVASATYEGKAIGDSVEFEARLAIRSFENGPVTLSLPFTDVRLQDDGWLDGSRAFLVAAPAGQAGFQLRVEKPGIHILVLHFRVPLTAEGSEREVRFRVPHAPQSQLTLFVPSGATQFQALVRQGSLTRHEPSPADTTIRYTAELGRTGAPLVFQWHEPSGAVPGPVLRVREAHLWSLEPGGATLTTVLHYTVVRGAPSSLTLELPQGLEVQDATARPPDPGRPSPAVAGWRVESEDGKRRLRVEFADPLAHGAYVILRLVPRGPLPALATLPVPTPVGAQLAGGFLAYTAKGVEAHVANTGRLRGPYGGAAGAADIKAFADLWSAAGESGLPTLPAPHALQREPGGEPFLQVSLRVATPVARGGQQVTWHVSARQADLRAVARLTAPDGDLLSLVEWEIPANVVVSRVGGRGGRDPVARWSRAGNRVQAWFDHAAASAVVELEGWRELPAEADGARFDLPGVHLLSAEGAASLRLTADPDVAVVPEDTQLLVPVPGRELTYVPRAAAYGGRFHVRRAAVGGDSRILTIVEAAGGQLTFTAYIECRPNGGPRAAEVRLRRWPGEARLSAEVATRPGEPRRQGDEHSWTIELPPSRDPVRLTLAGRLPLPAAGMACPEVSISGSGQATRWLATGAGLTAEGAQQLATLAGARGSEDLPAAGRARAERALAEGGVLFRVGAADWALRLLPRRSPEGTRPVRVALTEYGAAVVDGRRWIHEATLWLFHEANTDVSVVLPQGARVVGTLVDGLAVTPLAVPPEGVTVPLPGAVGAYCVRIRWTFEEGTESLDRPRLQRPRLPNADDGPVAWTVHVPAEYMASFAPEGRGGMVPSGPSALDAARAEAQYRLSAALADEAGSSQAALLALAQLRFYQYCRYAEAGRLLSGSTTAAVNVQGQTLEEWLQSLREKNAVLAHEQNFEELRAKAERDAAEAASRARLAAGTSELPDLEAVGLPIYGDPLPARGTPLRWRTGPDTEASRLQLTPLTEVRTKRAAGASLLLAVLLLTVWALTYFPDVLGWVRAFWPEQVALLACVGWQTYGPALPLLVLIALGVTARLLFLGRRLLSPLHRPQAEPSHRSGPPSAPVAEPRPAAP